MEQVSATVDGGKLQIDLYDLLGSLTGEARANVIDMLACRQEVIDEVMNQVIDGYTSQGSYGPTGLGGNPEAIYGIDGARMRIAKASSEIASREIERLAQEMARLKARINEGWDAYHELLRSREFTASAA